MSPEDRNDWRLVGYWLAICALMAALAIVQVAMPQLLAGLDAWLARNQATQAQFAQQVHAVQDARQAMALQLLHCGPESGIRPRRDGALECTDKRGRRSGLLITQGGQS